ncbi:MAG: peptidylprolyl isomerase [Pseudomonadota bacterium]
MIKQFFICLGVVAACLYGAALAQDVAAPDVVQGILDDAPEDEWRIVDPDNVLVLDLPSGELLVEMRPDLAPRHIERITTLVRQGFYDGLLFHRVIDGFMAQGGDPLGDGTGGSDLPDLPAEFVHFVSSFQDVDYLGRGPRSPRIGFIGSVPVASQSPSLTSFLNTDDVMMWPMHCPGVMSMARSGDPNSANSQYFIMIGDSRDALDQRYTAWGKVLTGERNVRRINRGEPPDRPTPMLRLRLMPDLPLMEQREVEVLKTDSESFKAWLRATGGITDDGFFPDICSINVPVRIGGEITS